MGIFLVLFCAFFLRVAETLDAKEVVFVIISQSNPYHRSLAENLRDEIRIQAQLVPGRPSPIVHLSHEDFPRVPGAWAVLPLISHLSVLHPGNCSWFFFAEERTAIRLEELLNILKRYDADEEIWLGHAVHDREPTIIHHFAFFEKPEEFKYPNTASGFAISGKLLKSLSNRWKKREKSTTDFSIDHAYELALFVRDKTEKGPSLKHEPNLCTAEGENCATFPIPFRPCGKLIPNDSIYFAVKTCQKFHKERVVSVVKRTWGRRADVISFFSDVHDDVIPTISLGIPNTERGHCGKTMAIVRHVANNIRQHPEIRWLVLADDDTILSVARLQELLSCYDPEAMVALGERYGYNVYSSQGYNYITGGGGIVLSRGLVEKLAEPETCECPSMSSPDDMFLGVCMARLGVDVTHSPVFHQARPMDYPPEYLETQPAVSFHKHWMVDPISVYEKWFSEADLQLKTHSEHSEL